MQERTDRFLGLSVALTGFGPVELLGTGMVDEYLRTADAILPAGLLDDLVAAFERLPQDDGLEAALASQVMDDPRLGPVARNLVVLWYCGTWTALPDAWRDAYGASPLDTNRVVSADAYQSGLQWVAAGAHAAGAQEQGFGAWALAPGRSGP
jgi:hypothetical protein